MKLLIVFENDEVIQIFGYKHRPDLKQKRFILADGKELEINPDKVLYQALVADDYERDDDDWISRPVDKREKES